MSGSWRPTVIVVDSIQTVFTATLESAPGTVSQVRESAGKLMMLAKGKRGACFLVGHVTKDGSIAVRASWNTWSIRFSTSRGTPVIPSAFCEP